MLSFLLWGATASAAPVLLDASDGVHLKGDVWGKGTQGVVLIHGDGRTRADWSAWGPRLAEQGMLVLAIDLRGHGESSLGRPMADADWQAAARDVSAAVAWMRRKSVSVVSVVAVDSGGNAAMAAAAVDPGIHDLTWLSPRPTAHGMTARLQLASWAGPTFFVASDADTLSAKTATLLAESAKGPHHVVTVAESAAGVNLLDVDPGIGSTFISWLNGSLMAQVEAAARGAAQPPKLDDIHASGTAIEDKQSPVP